MRFWEYYETARDEINERLVQLLEEKSDDKKMHELFHSCIEGGKRFRPTLTLLTFDMLGGENREKALTHGAIIELLHEASLVQDDVIDYDKERRGMPSLWNKLITKSLEGLEAVIPERTPGELRPKVLAALMSQAVLMGDGLISIALTVIDDPETMQVFAEGILSLSKGAMKEAEGYFRTKLFGTDDNGYIGVIRGKTASLFSVAMHLGAISARATAEQKEMVRDAGLCLGICYQLADDISEGDVPRGVNGVKLLEYYAREYDTLISKMPDNEYREMFNELLPYMVNKLMQEENYKHMFLRTHGGGYMWLSRDHPLSREFIKEINGR